MTIHTDSEPAITVRAIHPVPEQGIALRVLGEVEAAGSHGTYAPGRTRPGALLALLAIHAGECVAVDRAIDELWTTAPAAHDAKRVQVNVLRLRRSLAAIAPDVDPAALVRRRSCGYALDIDPDAVDAARFERLIARGRGELDAGEPRRALATLRGALALWRGEPYADYAYEPFVVAEARRLEELRMSGLETWVEAQLALGSHAAAVAELQRLVARHPLRERLHALLMLALYRCGRQGDALAAFHCARMALIDALGIEPGGELRRLQRGILDQSPLLDYAGGGTGTAALMGQVA